MTRFFVVFAVVASLSVAAWAETRSARSFAHTVTTEAARVEPPDGDKSYVSIRCWQAGASPVYLGGKDVTPTNGYAICTNNPHRGADHRAGAGWTCAKDSIRLDVTDLYAVVSPPQGAPGSPAIQSLSCIIVQ
jgi:hypothetical protein